MLWCDIVGLKRLMQIDPDNHNEDWLLNFYNTVATDVFETILDRKFTYAVRTKVYKGSGTQKLLTRYRPIYPTAAPTTQPSVVAPGTPFQAISVVVDEGGNFGLASGAFSSAAAQTLVLGTDYTLDCNRDDGGCDDGILLRVNDVWFKPSYRQRGLLTPFVGPDTGSIQVTCTAGFTVDSLPPQLQMAAMKLVTRLSYLFPLGMELNSESYVDRSISLSPSDKQYLMGFIYPDIWMYRNWSF